MTFNTIGLSETKIATEVGVNFSVFRVNVTLHPQDSARIAEIIHKYMVEECQPTKESLKAMNAHGPFVEQLIENSPC